MTTAVLTNAEKLRRLHWNTTFNAANSVFATLTFFGPAYVLFLSELHFSNTEIGFLLSLMPFTALVAPVIAPGVARFGYKRTFITFFGIRKIITAGLLLVPAIIAQGSQSLLLLYVTLVAGGFALCRAIAETGMYPWAQEFIPNNIRGRYSAINDIFSRVTAILSIGVASYILGLGMGLNRFMLLFALGLVFGAIAVWTVTRVPGGAPRKVVEGEQTSYRHLMRVLKDRNFLLYVAGIGILVIGTTPMGSFMPLYMEQQIGLDESRVVLLQIGGLVGGLTATYLVGWAADRYGSKPVMLTGLLMKAVLPLAYLLIPRHSELSLPAAFMISLLQGIADIAWAIGSARLLYVKVVPSEKSAEYMAVYYALVGFIGGVSQVFGGGVLDLTAGLSGQFLIFTIDPFFPLFIFAIVLTIVSIVLFSRVEPDSPMGVGEFAGLFIHGNPVLALESLVRYYRAKDERETVAVTEKMGRTKSLLTVDELLEALKDPRFNVRFEAIVTIARMEPDPRLVEALLAILDGTELSLGNVAAWALGRMGDPAAIPSLRHGLDSPYRSIQAHCARALGTLGDKESAPLLLERLKAETDKGLRIAFSSALGKLGMVDSVETLLGVLRETENEGARLELALALARLVGGDHHFIRLLRQFRQDKGTAASQAISALKRRLGHRYDDLIPVINECADAFARENFTTGMALMRQILLAIIPQLDAPCACSILQECAAQFETSGDPHGEYLLMALHTLFAAEI